MSSPRPNSTLLRSIKFGPTGQNASQEDPLFQIQNRKSVIIAPPDVKQGDLELMK